MLAFAFMTLVASVFGQTGYDADLNGTYRIDSARSEDVSSMVESIASSYNLTEQQRTDLEDQLTPPDIVSIKTDPYNSKRVTVSTSSSAEATFQADGRSQRVGDANVSATLRNGVLRLSRVGGDSSFRITFKSADNGSALNVTRMVTTGYLNQTVYADSYYSKQGAYSTVNPSGNDTYGDTDVDDGYSSSDPDDVANNRGNSTGSNYPQTRNAKGTFIVPKGVVLTGTLNNKITTRSSQDNDRFSMSVESPGEFQGAVVKGYLSGVKRSGRVTGSSRVTFNFETIRLRTGEVYDFAGVLQSVTDSTGKVIDIGDEGDAKGDSKTK